MSRYAAHSARRVVATMALPRLCALLMSLAVLTVLSGCAYWPAVRVAYGNRVKQLDGPAAVSSKLIVVRAKVLKLRYPHHATLWFTPPDDDAAEDVPATTQPNCNTSFEPDTDNIASIPKPIFVTGIVYLKIVRGIVPHHSFVRYIKLDFGNDQVLEYYFYIGRMITLRFTAGGRLYDIPHAPG
jgi:hypothetical protein